MKLSEAQELAEDLMYHHGLHDWYFEWNNRTKTFGLCHYGRKTIYLSEPLTLHRSVEDVKDTILHEIAHALAGPHAKHGWEWKRVAMRLGASPRACRSELDAVKKVSKYVLFCESCNASVPRARRPRKLLYCRRCHDYRGQWNKLSFGRNPEYVSA